MKTSPLIPLPLDVIKINGGQICDMKIGPCACGSWHDEEQDRINADDRESHNWGQHWVEEPNIL